MAQGNQASVQIVLELNDRAKESYGNPGSKVREKKGEGVALESFQHSWGRQGEGEMGKNKHAEGGTDKVGGR